MITYVEDKVKSKSLWCSKCKTLIIKGSTVIFQLDDEEFEAVYCEACSTADEWIQKGIIDSEQHPFDFDE